LKLLEGQVWQWIISATDLPLLKQNFIVSGTIRREGGVQVRVVSKLSPTPQAHLVPPNLEDVYLQLVSGIGASA
jgi:ABC-2 type transport system ATP-binding protein